jgi:L-ascorbate metabolism protein UlaG (beta-lactamase superfamily)
MPITVTWLGHSGFRLEIEQYSVLVDPFLTGNPLASISADELPADFIVVTHGHGDHLGDTVAIAKRTNAMVISNVEICNWLSKQGVKQTHGQNTGGGFQHPFGHVKLVRADHSSSLPDGTYGGQANGFVLTADSKRLYFAGDTALFSDMRLIGEQRIDLAFLPIGDNFTMGPDEALTATKWLQPREVFPIHYNTFDVIYQDGAAWARRINNETNSQAIIVDPGSSFSI